MASPSEMSITCRLCLIKGDEQVNIPIFEDHGDIKQIFHKISACLPVKISKEDQLPKKICDRCSDKLDLLYEFRNTSKESENTLLSWLAEACLKVDDQTISAVAQQITKPLETLIKQEADTAEESSHLDLAQHSSIDEFQEAEGADEPPAKRPRRSAAIKARISIAPESDEDDMIDEPEMIDEPDTDNDDEIVDEPDTVDAEALTKIEDESDDNDADVPGTSAYDDQPGPSGLGKDGAEAPFMIKNLWKEEADICETRLIDPKEEVFEQEEKYSINSPMQSEDIEQFQCNICPKKFETKENLSQHLKIHTPFKCHICETKFKWEFSLKQHLFLKHPNTKDSDNYLNQHLKTYSKNYSFECDFCRLKFKNKYSFNKHLCEIYP